MVFFEYKGDLFNAAKDLHLKNDDLLFAHCISSDFALGAGIAKVFRYKYKVKEQLPRIGCGLDKLEWGKVRDMIQRVFSDMCINIYVYTL